MVTPNYSLSKFKIKENINDHNTLILFLIGTFVLVRQPHERGRLYQGDLPFFSIFVTLEKNKRTNKQPKKGEHITKNTQMKK